MKDFLLVFHEHFNVGGTGYATIIDDRAFKAENPDSDEIYDVPLNFKKYQYVQHMTLDMALRLALRAVPSNNATFVVMSDHVLITTLEACSPKAKLSEKVHGIFDKRPLHAALRELSEKTG